MPRAMRTSWLSAASAGRGVCDDVQRAGAFAVQAEVLRARHRHQQLGQFGAEQPDRECVFGILPVAQTLVGHVDVRQQRATLARARASSRHCFLGQVSAGRVVAGSMQQHDERRRQLLQRRHMAPNFTPPVAARSTDSAPASDREPVTSGTWLAQVGVLTCTVACGAPRGSAPRRGAARRSRRAPGWCAPGRP